MSKVTVQFEIETSRIPDLEAFLNGSSKPKGGKKKDDDEEPDFGAEEEEEPDFGAEEGEEGEEEKKIDKKTILAAIKERVNAGKAAQLSKLCIAFKIKNVSGLKESQYEKFYEQLKKIKV